MSDFNGLVPMHMVHTKRPSFLREEFQKVAVIGIQNCILPNADGSYGGKLQSYNGLQATFSGFEAAIGSKFHRLSNPADINLTSIKAALVYAEKQASNGSITPTLGKVDAQPPEPDSYTVVQYRFNQEGNPTDYSTQSNDIGTMVGTTRVSGIFDYGREFDGIDDYMVSEAAPYDINTAVEREKILCFKPLRITGSQMWAVFGSNINRWFYIYSNDARLYCGYNNTPNGDTGYDLEAGKVYKVSYGYDGANIIVKINGVIVYSAAVALDTNGTTITLGSNAAHNSQFAKGIYYYFEIRNKMRTFEANAAISNKLLLPCTYGRRDIRDDVLTDKTNQNIISMVQTDETKLISYDDESWKYGRRDDYRAGFGNRKVFSGWFSVGTNDAYNVINVLGTDKLKPIQLLYKKYLTDNIYSVCQHSQTGATWSSITSVSKNTIQVKTGSNGVIHADLSYTNTAETTGFLGFWMEAID